MITKIISNLVLFYFLTHAWAPNWAQEHTHVSYLPHFSQKQGEWQTTLGFYNPSSTTLYLHIEAFGANGAFLGEQDANLPPHGNWDGSLWDLLGPLAEETGWLRLASSDPALSGTVTFQSLVGQGRTSLPLHQAGSRGLIFPMLETTTSSRSGIVLVNPTHDISTVDLRITGLNRSHEQLRQITLQPNSKYVAMLEEIFPKALPARLSMEVIADQSILGFGLMFQNGLKQIVAAPASAWDPGLLPELRDIVNKAHERAQIRSGFSLAVDHPQWGTLATAVGEADLEQNIAMQADTITEIASITKTFIAALFLKLQEEGLLNLADSVSQFMPDFPRGDDLTLQLLLSHQSGLPNYTELASWEEAIINASIEGEPAWTPQRILAETLENPFLFEPGSQYYYSNTNYLVLAMIAEQRVGKNLGQQLREKFWTPLGMNSTFMAHSEETPERAQTYFYNPVENALFNVSDLDIAWLWGTSVVSTAEDLITWGKALLGGHVLEPSSLQQMLTPAATNQNDPTYGLGMGITQNEGPIFYGHSGRNYGATAQLMYFPDSQITLSFVVNANVVDEAYETMLDELFQLLGASNKHIPMVP